METVAGSVKFLGNTDDVTVCECCGRQDLKSTVALSINESEPVYFGVVCAARALGMAPKDVRTAAKSADEARARAEQAAKDAKHRAEMAAWISFLTRAAGPGEIVDQIKRLGGYAAARAQQGVAASA